MVSRLSILAAAAGLTAAACSTTGLPERNAAVGAAAGAAAGAIIGNNVGDGDAQTGALIGGAIGAVAGAYTGCQAQGGCYVGGRQVQSQLQYDSYARRYYYVDPQTGRTYWQNGEPRT